jgi:hypothetical protein
MIPLSDRQHAVTLIDEAVENGARRMPAAANGAGSWGSRKPGRAHWWVRIGLIATWYPGP